MREHVEDREEIGMNTRALRETGATAILGILLCVQVTCPAEEGLTKQDFERRYEAWKDYVMEHEYTSLSSTIGINEALDEIVELGLPAVPFIVEKLEKQEWEFDFQLAVAMLRLIRRGFSREEYPPGRYAETYAAGQLYIKWWKEGRKKTPALFERYYTEWKQLKAQGKDDEAEASKKRLRKLGVDALPLFIDKIGAGDAELIPVVATVTRKVKHSYVRGTPDAVTYNVQKDATREEVLAWWAANKEEWTLPPIEEAVEEGTRESGEAPDGGAEPSGDGGQ